MISYDAPISFIVNFPFTANPNPQFPSKLYFFVSRNVSSDVSIFNSNELKLCPRYCSKQGRVIANAYAVNGGFERAGRRDVDEQQQLQQEREIWDRAVNCEVDVISWRERRIKAEISVNSDVDSVWNALTDYERLADFVPNLVCSGRIPCPYPGRIWLEQRGFQRALYWHIEARVVLDLQEVPISVSKLYIPDITFPQLKMIIYEMYREVVGSNDRELHFSMVDGDFKKFEGKWSVKSKRRSSSTTLSYEVNVMPKFNFPAIFLERIIRSDLPVNLRALACRAESNFEGNQKMPVLDSSKAEISVNSGSTSFSSALKEKNMSDEELEKSSSSPSLGPLPQAPSELNSKWGIYGKVCRLDRPCLVDEIHLRRFDGLLENGGVHRCVVASITVKASVHDVWDIITGYENLPEIVPNLAISKVLSRDNNKVRILQEGCKGLLYMVLHARVVMDLCEQHEQEISFMQVEGDFDSFHGKWHFEQLGNHHTLLKYSVESKMRHDMFLSEAIMEEVIYEDLPSNLCAIRDYIEKKTETILDEPCVEQQKDEICKEESSSPSNKGDTHQRTDVTKSSSSTSSPIKQRPRVPGLQQDIEVLKSEILKFVSAHGQEGFMPMRKQLRSHGRVDIEKAINRMGGFRRIATLMNLSLAYKHRKPKGFWDNLENLQEEINRFQKNWGIDPSYMPSRKTFERAGRYDIARALEKWGGLHEVSRLLSLRLRHPNKQQANISSEKKIENASSDCIDAEETPVTQLYTSLDTQNWLTELNDLDINWVE